MNHKSLMLGVAVLLLILAGCAADENSDTDEVTEDASPTEEPIATEEPTATEEPEPTATPEPEPTTTPVEARDPTEDEDTSDEDSAFDDDMFDDDTFGESDDTFGTVPEVQLEEFHDEALGNLLLSSEQLPDGWVQIIEGSLPDEADATQGLGDLMSGPCGNDLLTPERMGYPVHVGRIFMGPEFGPFFSQDLYEFDDPDAAATAMDLATTQLDCDDWTAEDPISGMDMKYTVEDLDFPDLGDETVAVSLSISVSSDVQAGVQQVQHQTQFNDPYDGLSSEMVMVRQGNKFSTFNHMDWFGVADLDLEAVVALAVEQVANAE